MSNSKYFRILSIDGGGIRGLIPAQILTVVEEKLKEASGDPTTRISDWFDLVAGTSTGGLLTCIYLCPEVDNPNRSRFAAKEAVDLYLRNGDRIFDTTLWQRIKSGDGILDEKYSSKGLETLLQEVLGDLKLSDLIKPCLITAYDLENRQTYFFTQHDAVKNNHRDFFLRDVARATSAAPTFFETAQIKSQTNVSYTLVDGGVFANDPALCAYAEARKMGSKPIAKDMLILSLGTGIVKTPYQYDEVKDWGGLQWVRPVIDILMAGTVEVADYQLRQMYKAVEAPEQYLRIQPLLAQKNSDLGNTDPENLSQLIQIGQRAAEEKDEVLDQFVKLLLDQK